MTSLKTTPSDIDVSEGLASITPEARLEEARQLLALYREATGYVPVLWGKDMIGFGRYTYTYASGHSGAWFATGFAARKAALSFYILPGYQDYQALLARLGPHKPGKSCFVVKSLQDIDQNVLIDVVKNGLQDLAQIRPIFPR